MADEAEQILDWSVVRVSHSPHMLFTYDTLISVFQSSNERYQNQLVAKIGCIHQTKELHSQLRKAKDRSVVVMQDRFDINAIEKEIESKAAFGKTIDKDVIVKILRAVEQIHSKAIEDFDTFFITYSSIPVFVFVNSSKLDFDATAAEMETVIEKLQKDSELPPQIKEHILDKIDKRQKDQKTRRQTSLGCETT